MRRDLDVLFLSSEVVPFSKTGGLADVAGALPTALAHQGCRVTVATPFYGDLLTEKFPTKPLSGPLVSVPVGARSLKLSVRTLEEESGGVSYIFGANSEIIARDGLYSEPDGGPAYEDNDVRFVLFCRGMMEWIRRAGRQYDILHLNDWQTALIAPYLRSMYADDPYFARARTVLTVHNLAYQGVFPAERFELLGLGAEELTPMSPFEFWGKVNFLKSGLVYAHKINTVSPTYAHEIQTDKVLGSGLDGVLRDRSRDLTGILNGIDSRIWNPTVDSLIATTYGPRDVAAGKRANKEALLERAGIPAQRWARPLIGIISRLADQKGFDLIERAANKLFALDVNLIVLGTGEQRFHDLFKKLAKRHPGRIAVFLKFDNTLSHQIEAGADMFLMPSRYEPCGLNQMYSLAYGTVPIVRATGGLADTVADADLSRDAGTGFVFADYTPAAMMDAIRRAVAAFADNVRWADIRRRGMELDFSWERSAANYRALYEAAHEVDAPAPIHHH
jgi:starch synthase